MVQAATRPDADERRLRLAAALFVVAYLIHAGDHLRRGISTITWQVFWAGNLQGVLGLVTVVLILTRHRWGPAFAFVVGFGSAVGFVAAHFLPDWGPLSDSFVSHHVIWFSWFAAVVEVLADLFLGYAGWRSLPMHQAVPPTIPAGAA
jgi:hypothetical protein